MFNKLFSSRRFFLVNLVLTGIVLGFGLALLSFSCSTNTSPRTAYAQDEANDGSAMMDLQAMQNSFRAVSAEVLPVVVEITVTEITRQQVPTQRGWPFDFFFPDQAQPEGAEPQEREFRSQGLGSGVIVRKDKSTYYVLTNNHVVGDADEINVILYDDREFPATLVGKDPRKDLALIQFESRDDLPLAVLGDSNDLYVGDWVLAVGNPLGYVSTVTAGIVSALGRDGPQDNISDFIQTDAAINQGNSGGALVNLKGEVIGINTWIATPSGSNAGLGFAIPINNAKKAIDDFISKGEIEYGWLGVSISDISKPVAQDLQVEGIKGAMIQNVYTDSPADKSGLLPGDYVTAINGESIESYLDLTRTVGDLLPNETYDFELIRYGKKVTLPVSIGLRENDESIAASYMDLWPGISIAPLTDEIRKELEIDESVKGLLLLVNEKSKAQMAGLKSYDIVTAINDRKVETALDFYRELNSNENRTNFLLLREGSVEMEIGIRR